MHVRVNQSRQQHPAIKVVLNRCVSSERQCALPVTDIDDFTAIDGHGFDPGTRWVERVNRAIDEYVLDPRVTIRLGAAAREAKRDDEPETMLHTPCDRPLRFERS